MLTRYYYIVNKDELDDEQLNNLYKLIDETIDNEPDEEWQEVPPAEHSNEPLIALDNNLKLMQIADVFIVIGGHAGWRADYFEVMVLFEKPILIAYEAFGGMHWMEVKKKGA